MRAVGSWAASRASHNNIYCGWKVFREMIYNIEWFLTACHTKIINHGGSFPTSGAFIVAVKISKTISKIIAISINTQTTHLAKLQPFENGYRPRLAWVIDPWHSGRNQGFLSNGCIGCIYLVKILAHCAMLQCMSRYKSPLVALTTTASLTITIKLGAIKYFC